VAMSRSIKEGREQVREMGAPEQQSESAHRLAQNLTEIGCEFTEMAIDNDGIDIMFDDGDVMYLEHGVVPVVAATLDMVLNRLAAKEGRERPQWREQRP